MDFQRYLLAKKSIDDRALNRNVFEIFSNSISNGQKQTVLELGGGVGTMVQRITQWVPRYDLNYTLMDIEPANLELAYSLLSRKARYAGNKNAGNPIPEKQLRIKYLNADIYGMDSIEKSSFDGIIANAFFDLVDLETVFPILRQLLKPGGWVYATINFDGQTIFEPVIDELLDLKIINAYHASMTHPGSTGSVINGSYTGRKLFEAFQNHDFEIKGIGSSDWVVFPHKNQFTADEKYFLEMILYFIKGSVKSSDLISEKEINEWLDARKKQLEDGKLLFIAHQLDYFAIKD